jgi:hypothetical protein
LVFYLQKKQKIYYSSKMRFIALLALIAVASAATVASGSGYRLLTDTPVSVFGKVHMNYTIVDSSKIVSHGDGYGFDVVTAGTYTFSFNTATTWVTPGCSAVQSEVFSIQSASGFVHVWQLGGGTLAGLTPNPFSAVLMAGTYQFTTGSACGGISSLTGFSVIISA